MTPTPSVTVSPSQPATPAAPAAPAAPSQAAGGTPAGEDVAAIKAELAALKSQVDETKRTAQFWYEKATKGQTPEPKPAAEPEENVDLLDLITTKGVKGLDELMAKRGYVRGADVDAKVNTKAAQMTTENQLMSDYPDLKDQKSEFFQATAAHYGELKKSGVPEHKAMELAARLAALDGIQSGKIKTPAQRTEAEKAQKEADRLARIKAQGGDRGNRTPEESADDDVLSDDDRAAVKQLSEALEIPLEDAEKRYVARAKAGVRVALKLDRRGR